MSSPQALLAARSALVIAHPGHEIRAYGWLELARPRVHVLSNGSGRGNAPRLPSTQKLLARVGAKPGRIFGRMSEAEFYQRVLQGDREFMRSLADELAASFVADEVEFVVGEAAEGEFLVADMLRAVIDAAVNKASAALGRSIANYEFTLAHEPDACPAELRHRALRLCLYDEVFERKLNAAEAYAELSREVRAAVAQFGVEAFRVECFWPACELSVTREISNVPGWERRGAALAASGAVAQPIRFAEHVAPLLANLLSPARLVA